jgi:flagellar hook-basal body complex protein FliE
MNRTILYYPTINIPNNAWLKHALLYWDEISSIIPQDDNDRFLIDLSPDILYLMDEGHFRPIRPESLISESENWKAFEEFQNEFKEVVSSPNFKRVLTAHRAIGKDYNIHRNKVGSLNLSKIHNNKTSDGLYDYLESHGLATRENGYEWISFERNTALLYMSLLAKYLADIDNQSTTIGTDKMTYESLNFKKARNQNGFPVVAFNLDSVLPTPKPNVPLEKIIKFKRRRADNLTHFKQTLSTFQTKISNSQSNAELKETAISFEENLLKGVKDLTEVLGDSKIESSLKTFKALINLKSPTLIASMGAVINDKYNYLHLPVDLTSIGIATIGAIELTTKYIEIRNQTRAQLRQSPFSYLYHARRSSIIGRK